jgi:hypothetical protein
MHREAQLHRSDLGTAVDGAARPKPIVLTAPPSLRHVGHCNGWALFARLLIFATRNNHR